MKISRRTRETALAFAFFGAFAGFAAEPGTATQPLTPAQVEEAGEKVQKITFMQDDAQNNIVSKVYELRYVTAADLAPFVKSAVIRFDPVSTATRLEDKVNKRQLLIVSTAVDMMPYVDEMVKALDRPGKRDASGGVISGTGIAYGTYQPQFRTAPEMRNMIVNSQISSGPQDSKVRFDAKTGLFYFKDSPYRVSDIKRKLEWLDKPVPQARIEFKIYQVRDSDLLDLGLDYLAWKNGPGLNLFEAGANMLNMKVAETIINQAAQSGTDLLGNFAWGFGGMYTAPAFDFSFLRILQQNGKAVVNSSASLLAGNTPGMEFRASFAPEYQNLVKDEDHRSSVDIGGNASLEAAVTDAVITAGGKGVVNFTYRLSGSNVVERNNLGTEISENTSVGSSVTLNFQEERLLTAWERESVVEQTIGIPFLCELPVLKYIFGTTTKNKETIRYFVTARAVPVQIQESMKPGETADFDELAKK